MTGLPETWCIGLDAWMIQDGNYGDFSVGQTVAFAVEFTGDLSVGSESISPIHETDSKYWVSGPVTAAEEELWMVDFGISALNTHPEGFQVGDHLEGIVALKVDAYDYAYWATRVVLPPAIYVWRVAGIDLQTAPWVETRSRYFERDEALWGWRSIDRTDAWSDDHGNGQYLLTCELHDVPPRRRHRRFLL